MLPSIMVSIALSKSKSDSMPWFFVIAGCIGMFAATATGSTRAPFLPDIAADLGVSLPAIANLFGITAITWGVSSYLVGFASDRIGRRIFLIASPALLSLAMFAAAYVQNYWSFVGIVVFAGMSCGAFTSSTLAEVSLRAPVSHHGRAFGYVMSGQSLTLLFGIPVAAWLGARFGWRGTHLALAALAVFAVVFMVVALRAPIESSEAGNSQHNRKSRLKDALTGPIIRLFIALIAERVSFGLATFYYAAFLREAYDLAINEVALPLVGFALGNILGTVVGGQVADRYPYRRITFSLSLITAGIVALPWFLWPIGLMFSVAMGIVFAFFNALGRPALLASLADVPKDVRGVVMGMNSSIASIGWLVAALGGGWLYAGIGFKGFGPLMAGTCLVSAFVVLPDSRLSRAFTS